MYINMESDYAIRIMIFLAGQQSRVDAKTISAATGVPLRFALKILGKLSGANLVKSARGISGGYTILEDLESITLYDIIEVTEGKYQFSKCMSENFLCTNTADKPCEVHNLFNEITNEVSDRLKAATIKKLTSK